MSDDLRIADYRWWLLRCLSGKEERAAEFVRRVGFPVCSPQRTLFKKPSRYARGSGDREEYQLAALTGYLIVGIGHGTPAWSRIMVLREQDSSGLMGVFGIQPMIYAGQPCRVRPGDVRVLYSLGETGELDASDLDRMQNRGCEFQKGDVVEVLRGPFIDFTAEVKGFKDGWARINVIIFGRDTPVELRQEDLAKV